jgi:NitT/TauT family transport system ATP-binding protein
MSLAGVALEFAGGPPVLEEITLAIAPGELVAVVGPSGCGKSTLLRLLAGLLPPTRGTVDWQAGQAAPRCAFVFQDPTLLPWRTVLENVALPLELERHAPRPAGLVRETLRLVGLSPQDEGKYPRQLSGGMRMRVSLARAIVMRPDVLFLDEPFAALDDLLRQQLNEELLRWWGERGWTALFVTHNVSEAVFLSQRVLVMGPRPGRIVAEVAIDEPYPRGPEWRAEPRFAALAGEISRQLRQGAAA